jgi:hypothetical protein
MGVEIILKVNELTRKAQRSFSVGKLLDNSFTRQQIAFSITERESNRFEDIKKCTRVQICRNGECTMV